MTILSKVGQVISLGGQQEGSQYNSNVGSSGCNRRYMCKYKEDKSVLVGNVSISTSVVEVKDLSLSFL